MKDGKAYSKQHPTLCSCFALLGPATVTTVTMSSPGLAKVDWDWLLTTSALYLYGTRYPDGNSNVCLSSWERQPKMSLWDLVQDWEHRRCLSVVVFVHIWLLGERSTRLLQELSMFWPLFNCKSKVLKIFLLSQKWSKFTVGGSLRGLKSKQEPRT